MNLTPEQREIGKQNFNEAVGTTRRDFLKGAIASGAVTSGALGAMYFGYGGKVDKPVRIGGLRSASSTNPAASPVRPTLSRADEAIKGQ